MRFLRGFIYMKKIIVLCGILSQLMATSLLSYIETKNGLTLEILRYPNNTLFFSDLPPACQAYFNNDIFVPFRFNIINNSDRTFKFGSKNISAWIDTDYADICRNIPIVNFRFGLGFLGALAGGFGSIISLRKTSDGRSSSKDFLTRLKKSSTMKKLVGFSVLSGGVGIISLVYAIKEYLTITSRRINWFKKNGIPQEGITIVPGQSVKFIVCLDFTAKKFTVSLSEPSYMGDYTEIFDVAISD